MHDAARLQEHLRAIEYLLCYSGELTDTDKIDGIRTLNLIVAKVRIERERRSTTSFPIVGEAACEEP